MKSSPTAHRRAFSQPVQPAKKSGTGFLALLIILLVLGVSLIGVVSYMVLLG